MNQEIPLSQLCEKQTALVAGLRARGTMRRRLRDLGLTDGARVVCLQKSPLGDPTAYIKKEAKKAKRACDAGLVLAKEVGADGAREPRRA